MIQLCQDEEAPVRSAWEDVLSQRVTGHCSVHYPYKDESLTVIISANLIFKGGFLTIV